MTSAIFEISKSETLDPLKYAKDALALSCIRRANLNSIWSQEPSTVSQNASQARTMEELGEALGFDSVAPRMGPFPLEETYGMKIACVTLLKSLAPGKWENTVQYATVRKMRSIFSNLYHASYHGESMSVMAYETQKCLRRHAPAMDSGMKDLILAYTKEWEVW